MLNYLIKNSSNKLNPLIMKLFLNKIDILNYRITMVYLANLNASNSVLYEYEKLHDDYYLEKRYE